MPPSTTTTTAHPRAALFLLVLLLIAYLTTLLHDARMPSPITAAELHSLFTTVLLLLAACSLPAM